ncbi:hypothetical protein BSM4216_2847 [Bacillus smithii]|nr:hypothetical protein BSM4216_2847 [Bacillus smithii]
MFFFMDMNPALFSFLLLLFHYISNRSLSKALFTIICKR